MDTDQNNAQHAILSRTILRSELRAGLVFACWGLVTIVLAFFTFDEGAEQYSCLSWLLISVIVFSIIGGLVRLFLSLANPIRSLYLPFDEGESIVELSADSRVQLFVITADNGRILSWDLFAADMKNQQDVGVFLRIDHICERILARFLCCFGIRYVSRAHGLRLYPWIVLRLWGKNVVVRALNKGEALDHRARLLVIEM